MMMPWHKGNATPWTIKNVPVFVHNFEKCRPMLKILTLLNSAVNLPRDPCQGHREFPFGNSLEFPGICLHKNSRREFPGILHISSLIFFLLESALCKTAIYIQKLTHFIHKSIQYYIDNNTEHQKKIRASTINGPWELIKPAILGALTTLHSSWCR